MPGPDPVPPIELEVATPASPDAAWAAITDPAQVAGWFTDVSPLGPVGSTYRVDFGAGSVVSGPVLELEPGRSFTHAWAWEGASPYETTTVTWSVAPAPGGGSGSVVRLVHDGWHDAGLDQAARDDHEGYWSAYLEDLAGLLGEA